jgi:hypothetical protein
MRVMGGHSGVDHVREHLFVVADFEFLRVRVEAEILSQLDDPLVPFTEIFDAIGYGHGCST